MLIGKNEEDFKVLICILVFLINLVQALISLNLEIKGLQYLTTTLLVEIHNTLTKKYLRLVKLFLILEVTDSIYTCSYAYSTEGYHSTNVLFN